MKGVLLACTLLAPPAGLPSNVTPLAFGMTPQQVATALGAPLTYVSGRPRAEIYYTVTPAGVPGGSTFRGFVPRGSSSLNAGRPSSTQRPPTVPRPGSTPGDFYGP